MLKKIFVSLAVGLATLGVLLMVIGSVLGGRLGSYGVQNSKIVYKTASETIEVADAPAWMNNMWVWGGAWGPGWYRNTTMVTSDYNYAYEASDYAYGQTDIDGWDWYGNGDYELDSLYVEIPFGYLTILPQDLTDLSPGLHADGPMRYDWDQSGGSWYLYSDYNSWNISSKLVDGITHYFLNGEDLTTHFTIVVPGEVMDIYVEANAASVSIEDIDAYNLTMEINAGAAKLTDVRAYCLDLRCNGGAIITQDMDCEELYASVGAGAAELQGEVQNFASLDCSAGSIKLNLEQPEGYSYYVENSLGSVNIDGQKFGGISSGSGSIDDNGALHINVECSVGSVDVNFQ